MNTDLAQGTLLVPIDVHGITPTALETVVKIARLLDRNLLGLMIEDARLRGAAALPFATEIALSDARERSLMDSVVQRRQRRVSVDNRRLLHDMASRERIALQLEDMAGPRWACALQRDGHLDIFMPARQRRQLTLHRNPVAGATAIPRLGVFPPEGAAIAPMLGVAAVLIGAGLVGSTDVLASRPLPPDALHDLHRTGKTVRFFSHIPIDENSIVQLIRQNPYSLLLIHAASIRAIAPTALETALDASPAQVLVIHQS